MNSVVFRTVLVLVFLIPSAPLWASQAWASLSGGATVTLYSIDAETGAASDQTAVYPGVPRFHVSDLAADPGTRGTSVWAVRLSLDETDLVAVDPYRQVLLSRAALDAPEPIVTLAIDSTSGEFYGTSASALYRILPDTGTTILVGATPLSVEYGLGFDRGGRLYGVANQNQLVEIDKLTGGILLTADLGEGRVEDIAARPEDGLMYGIGIRSRYSLFRIDVGTGNMVTVGDSLLRPSGLAFSAVPEPSTVSLGVAAILFAIAIRATKPAKPNR